MARTTHDYRRERERGLDRRRLSRVLDLIDRRLAEPVRLDELAAAAHLSPFHFARMFRRSTGMSPHAFITRRRVERAARILDGTSIPVAVIARMVGYRTQAHFTRVFRKTMGLTPFRYRNHAAAAAPLRGEGSRELANAA